MHRIGLVILLACWLATPSMAQSEPSLPYSDEDPKVTIVPPTGWRRLKTHDEAAMAWSSSGRDELPEMTLHVLQDQPLTPSESAERTLDGFRRTPGATVRESGTVVKLAGIHGVRVTIDHPGPEGGQGASMDRLVMYHLASSKHPLHVALLSFADRAERMDRLEPAIQRSLKTLRFK